jgi:hypothetical protein
MTNKPQMNVLLHETGGADCVLGRSKKKKQIIAKTIDKHFSAIRIFIFSKLVRDQTSRLVSFLLLLTYGTDKENS